jgi:phospholipase D1/2
MLKMDMKYSFEKITGKARHSRAKLSHYSDSQLSEVGKDVANYLNLLLKSEKSSRKVLNQWTQFVGLSKLFFQNRTTSTRQFLAWKLAERWINKKCLLSCSPTCCKKKRLNWFIVGHDSLFYLEEKSFYKEPPKRVILFDEESSLKITRYSRSELHVEFLSNNQSVLMKFTDAYYGMFISLQIARAILASDYGVSHEYGSFAPQRMASNFKFFIDGASYFRSVHKAIEKASKEILITDWMLSPQLPLIRPVVVQELKSEKSRLNLLLKKKAEEGVHILIIIYKEVTINMPHASEWVKQELESLHANIKVLRHPPDFISYWSHHEKLILIDKKKVYIGGLDLAFGRWDTPEHRIFDLDDNSQEQVNFPMLDYYNTFRKDFEDVRQFEKPFISKVNQPRMPWHDVGIKLTGEGIVKDFHFHFIKYWNSIVEVSSPMYKVLLENLADNFQTMNRAIKHKLKPEKFIYKDNQMEGCNFIHPDHFDAREDKFRTLLEERGVTKLSIQNNFNHLSKEQSTSMKKKAKSKSTDLKTNKWKKAKSMLATAGILDTKKGEKKGRVLDIDRAKYLHVEDEAKDTSNLYNDDGNWTLHVPEEGTINLSHLRVQGPRSLFGECPPGKKKKDKIFIEKQMDAISTTVKQHMSEYFRDEDSEGEQVKFSLRGIRSERSSVDINDEGDCFEEAIKKNIKSETVSGQGYRIQALRSASAWSSKNCKTERSIYNCYIELIYHAKRFIYIENQFFISSNAGKGVRNKIVEALFRRIRRAHKKKEKFKVIIFIPLMPSFEMNLDKKEGSVLLVSLGLQNHTIGVGANSIIQKLLSIGINPESYLMICSLRTHALKLTHPEGQDNPPHATAFSELIYIHSKFMLVDDLNFIVGSANLNDRSMMGDRDSELAVHVESTAPVLKDFGSQSFLIDPHIHQMRINLWHEHFALPYESIMDPLLDEVWEKMWAVATNNSLIYDSVFKCFPSNKYTSWEAFLIRGVDFSGSWNPLESYKAQIDKLHGHAVMYPYKFLRAEEVLDNKDSLELFFVPFKVLQ